MSKSTAPLIKVSTLAPFIRSVQAAGVSVRDLGAPIGLTAEMLNDPDALAPASSIYRFADLAADALKDPYLGVRLGLDPEITKWPVIADALAKSNVMIEFFARFLLEVQKFSTSVDFRFVCGSEISFFERDRGFHPQVNPAQVDAFSVGLFVNLFRSGLGDAWQGSDMLFKICAPDFARIPALGGCTIVKGDARTLTFSFPSRWLVLPLQHQEQASLPGATTKPPSEALIAAIRSNIRSNISDPDFSVPILVAQMGFNRRDVQRYLRSSGSGLADLIAEEKKALACDLIERGGITVEQVAQALGYKDVSNFSRAFRQWTGTSPSKWNQTQK